MSSSTPAQYDPPNKLVDFFPYTWELHPVIHGFYKKCLDSQKADLVGEPVLHITDYVRGPRVTSVGFTPINLLVGSNLRPRSEEWAYRQYPNAYTLGIFQFDPSNCGMCHFHHIDGLRQKGMGTAVLALIEMIAVYSKRKYVTCSVASHQIELGAARWLERNHYVQKDRFVGGNSGHTCYLYTKDLVAHPDHQTIWIPKKEPAK